MTDSDAQEAEFGTMAEWTAQAALALGPAHHIPAACRGSGGPPALDWLLDHCGVTADTRLLDVGAGVGGPGAYAAEQRGVRPTLLEPQLGACRAARRLFDLPVLCADALALPVPDRSQDVVWSLGVIDTVDDQLQHLTEVARVLRPAGVFGLLAYVAQGDVPDEPEPNDFPTERELAALVDRAGLRTVATAEPADLPPVPDDWRAREDDVDREIARRHSEDPAWQQAAEQERTVKELIERRVIRGRLHLLRPVD